jgi:thiol-disulfide isomerase/thioredoxin
VDEMTARGSRVVWVVLLLAACRTGSPPVEDEDGRAPGATTVSGEALREELVRHGDGGDWAAYWETLLRLCRLAPDAGEVRLRFLLPLANQPAWAMKVNESGEPEVDEGRIDETLAALEHLAAVGGPEQASEAWLVAALLMENAREPSAAAPYWRKLVARYPESSAGKTAAERLWEAEHLRVGARLPEVRWVDRAGEPVDLVRAGERTLVYFWCTDCPPCLELIEELKRRLGDGGVALPILGVSHDETRAAFEETVQRVSPPGRQVHADRSARFPIAFLPTTIVVSSGTVVAVEPDLAAWFAAHREVPGK